MFKLILAAMAFATGGVAMKYSDGLTRLWPSLMVFVLFSAGAALQALAMRHAPMGTTYVVVLGLEAVLASALGAWLFAEALTAPRLLAIALIVTGIVILKR